MLVLNEAGYIPSNSEKYPLGGIVSTIENAFHATPLVVCSEDSVKELHLCFYKDFKMIKKPASVESSSTPNVVRSEAAGRAGDGGLDEGRVESALVLKEG
ncbi:Ribonuclease 2 [Morella rubra]|uniref:Ribonuclease 2 n=1 Tax=Morella rubra TaxID=262757 RepID=A0A6A1US43_9ROSI|nr:Ribonuclease 2 [Morella rubra]